MLSSPIKVNFVLETPVGDILKRIQRRAEKDINIKTRNIKRLLEEELPKVLERTIKKSLQYKNLMAELALNAALYGEVGIPDIEERINKIIHWWCYEDCYIDFVPFKFTNSGMVGHLIVKRIKNDYTEVLSLEEAKYVIATLKHGLMELEWLEWLLLGGPGYIIQDYKYVKNERTAAYSRTKTGIMVPKRGSGWGLPDELAGTQDNNFLTKILNEVTDGVTNNIFSKIDRILK